MKSTFGEILFAASLSAVAAAFAAVVSVIGGVFVHGWMYGRGTWVASFYAAFGMMLLMPLGVFIFVFRKVIHYGDPDSLPSSK
jgi:hypothetical protein